MSQLGYMGSNNKLQRQKKGPWSLGERKAKVMCLGEKMGRERSRHTPERAPLGKKKGRACSREGRSAVSEFLCLVYSFVTFSFISHI